jgi:hypothetical protein
MSKNKNAIVIPNLHQFRSLQNYSGPISTIFLVRISWSFHKLMKLSSLQGLISGILFLRKVNSLIRATLLKDIDSEIVVSQIKMYNPIAIKPTIKLLKK